jgi:hypothetical protein
VPAAQAPERFVHDDAGDQEEPLVVVLYNEPDGVAVLAARAAQQFRFLRDIRPG